MFLPQGGGHQGNGENEEGRQRLDRLGPSKTAEKGSAGDTGISDLPACLGRGRVGGGHCGNIRHGLMGLKQRKIYM